MAIYSSQIGCGAAQLANIGNLNPDEVGCMAGLYGSNVNAALALYTQLKTCKGRVGYGILLFGDGVREGEGIALAAFISSINIGKVIASDVVKNPSHTESSHKGYQVWIWHVDRKATQEWWETMDKKIHPNPPLQTGTAPIYPAGINGIPGQRRVGIKLN